jgi:hypothetical protein
MSQPFLRHHSLYSPYFIFVQAVGVYSDIVLLHQLGISSVVRDFTPAQLTRSVFVTEDQKWLHVADDWSYTLWYTTSVRAAIANLAMRHDIFACSIGDIDHSFDFTYYHDARLARHYCVEATSYEQRSVVTDVGKPLPYEVEAMQAGDEFDIVLTIAQALGINTRHDLQAIRTYTHRQD